MNKQRRSKIQKEQDKLELMVKILEGDEINCSALNYFLNEIRTNIEEIKDEEEEAFDNMPEGLQCSARGETSEECIDLLNEAVNTFDELQEMINDENSDVAIMMDNVLIVIDTLENVINA